MFTKNISKFEEIEHTADIGILASAETLPELMANLAFGMLDIITGDIETQISVKRSIKVEGPTLMDLIVGWLSEINFLLTVHHYLVTGIDIISIDQTFGNFIISSDLYGKDSTPIESSFKTEIKAVTYHKLICEKRDDEYIGQVIFDI
jgi:SHS2 domain-containing protein